MKQLSSISRFRLENPDQGYVEEVTCFFNLLGLRTGHFWSTADYILWATDRQREYQRLTAHAYKKVDDFWVAFSRWLKDQVAGDIYILYQANLHPEYRAPLSALKKMGLNADDRHYDIAWSGKLDDGIELPDLESRFKEADDMPKGFSVQPIAVGDVIVIRRNGKRSAWFRDTDGFVKLPDFERQKWGDAKVGKMK